MKRPATQTSAPITDNQINKNTNHNPTIPATSFFREHIYLALFVLSHLAIARDTEKQVALMQEANANVFLLALVRAREGFRLFLEYGHAELALVFLCELRLAAFGIVVHI